MEHNLGIANRGNVGAALIVNIGNLKTIYRTVKKLYLLYSIIGPI